MPFKKLSVDAYPRRLWAIYGYPGSGKSTFAAQMRGPLLPIDADQRFVEVARLAAGDVYQLSDRPADNVMVEQIAEALRQNMPGSDVRTIVVDSLTAIIAPLVVQAMLDNDAGRNKNRMSAFKEKALAMRLLQDSLTMYGTDVLYIWHLQRRRNEKAEEQETATIPRTELARLTRSINVQLRVVQEDKRRGILVEWARRGRSGMTLWDDTGIWKGMPEKIEQAIYGGLTRAEQDDIEHATPMSFVDDAAAIAWGMDQGGFQALQHARNAFDKLIDEHQPQDAEEKWALWIADVRERLAKTQAGGPRHDYKAIPHPWTGPIVIDWLQDTAAWAQKNDKTAGNGALGTALTLMHKVKGETATLALIRCAAGADDAALLTNPWSYAFVNWVKAARDPETGDYVPTGHFRQEMEAALTEAKAREIGL